jgi:hypothetical protein
MQPLLLTDAVQEAEYKSFRTVAEYLGQQETIPTRKQHEIDGTGSTEEDSSSEIRGFWIIELQIAPVSHIS